MADSNVIIDVSHVHKSFHVGIQDVHVLKDISFQVTAGDFVVIFGPSGCGKSTLLHILLGLEGPTTGTMTFLGKNLYEHEAEDERSDFRKKHIGMVYQQPNWVKSLSVVENVAFPLLLVGKSRTESLAKATELLDMVGMLEWAHYAPTELSSGQQQRIALVRALVSNPEVIIADEPTGNLDYESGQALMELLQDMNAKQKKTIIMVTHDLEYIKYAKSAIRIFNGQVLNTYTEKTKDKLLEDVKSKRGKANTEGSERVSFLKKVPEEKKSI
jgi:ABC-type lipoprotein export system ATPase subunit